MNIQQAATDTVVNESESTTLSEEEQLLQDLMHSYTIDDKTFDICLSKSDTFYEAFDNYCIEHEHSSIFKPFYDVFKDIQAYMAVIKAKYNPLNSSYEDSWAESALNSVLVSFGMYLDKKLNVSFLVNLFNALWKKIFFEAGKAYESSKEKAALELGPLVRCLRLCEVMLSKLLFVSFNRDLTACFEFLKFNLEFAEEVEGYVAEQLTALRAEIKAKERQLSQLNFAGDEATKIQIELQQAIKREGEWLDASLPVLIEHNVLFASYKGIACLADKTPVELEEPMGNYIARLEKHVPLTQSDEEQLFSGSDPDMQKIFTKAFLGEKFQGYQRRIGRRNHELSALSEGYVKKFNEKAYSQLLLKLKNGMKGLKKSNKEAINAFEKALKAVRIFLAPHITNSLLPSFLYEELFNLYIEATLLDIEKNIRETADNMGNAFLRNTAVNLLSLYKNSVIILSKHGSNIANIFDKLFSLIKRCDEKRMEIFEEKDSLHFQFGWFLIRMRLMLLLSMLVDFYPKTNNTKKKFRREKEGLEVFFKEMQDRLIPELAALSHKTLTKTGAHGAEFISRELLGEMVQGGSEKVSVSYESISITFYYLNHIYLCAEKLGLGRKLSNLILAEMKKKDIPLTPYYFNHEDGHEDFIKRTRDIGIEYIALAIEDANLT